MMEGLLLVLLVLGFIAVVGHLLWLALAAGVRLLMGKSSLERADPIHWRPADVELHELKITARTIRNLLERGDLDRETANRLEQSLEARRRSLRPEDEIPAPRPMRPAPVSSLTQLQELLDGGAHPRDLPPSRRQAALACYRRLNTGQRAALQGPTLLAVARLLALAGMTSHALNAYRRLIDDPSGLPEPARIALEAGRLAVHEDMLDLAPRFLRAALAGDLPATEHDEARDLLRRLERPAQPPASVLPVEVEEISEAILVEPAEIAVRPVPIAPRPAPAVVAAPPRPRRSLTNVLAAFMEDRNILWGELTGGLLIVGCSIALVITLWHSLEELPYFPFLIFACITAALFAAGEYTLHHWKLQSTSRGLLLIALLLVPLNLLVLADPSLGHANSALEWAFKIAALGLSLGMVRLAGRDLIGVGVLPGPIDRRWLFLLAVVGAAGSQLIVPHLLDEEHPGLFVVLGCVPVACHLLACGAVVAGLARAQARTESGRLEVRQAHALFVFLGLSSFALFVALGFLLSRGAVDVALPRLAVPFGLAGVPILAGGLLVRRSLSSEDDGPRTAGTAVAFAGLAVMLSALALAWPNSLAVLLVALADAAVLGVLAFRWRLPQAHAVALPCLALAVLIAVQFSLGNLAAPSEVAPSWWLAGRLLSPTGGVALAVLMALVAAGSEGLARRGRRDDAAGYALGSAVLGVVAVLTTAWQGIDSPWPATLVHGLAAVCALAMHRRWRRAALPYLGLGLLVAASLWTLSAAAPRDLALWSFVLALESIALAGAALLGSRSLRSACRDVAIAAGILSLLLAFYPPDSPDQRLHTATAAVLALTAFLLAHTIGRRELAWLGSAFAFAALAHLFLWDVGANAVPRPLLAALLAHATLALLGGLILQARNIGDGIILHSPLSQSARLTSLLAVPLFLLPGVSALALAGYSFWLALLWLAVAWTRRSPAWFTAFQAALSVAVVFVVRAALPEQDWFDPRSLQAYGIGLGLLGFAWIAARMALSSRPRVRELWRAPWPSLERVVLGVLVVEQFALALGGIAPGVVAELTPAGYVASIDWPASAAHAYGPGSWLLLGVLALVLLAALREQGRASVIVGLLVLAATAPVLAAGPFDGELATASALRWGLALCYLTCSALLWMRCTLARQATAAGVTMAADSSAVFCMHTLLGVLAAAVLLLTGHVALLGFSGLRPTGPAPGSIFAEMGWVLSNVGPLLLLTAGLVGHAVRERSPGYAFTAGLVANASVTGGYALAVVTAGRHLDTGEIVCLGQLASLAAALWALAWQASRPWVRAWREVPDASGYVPSSAATPLMLLQIGLAVAGQLMLLGAAIFSLGDLSGRLTPWTTAAGSSLGWLALLASLAALLVWYVQKSLAVPWGILFVGGLATVALLACTVERTWPEAGYYFLLLGWPLYVLFCSALPLASARSYQPGAPATGRRFLSFPGFRSSAPRILAPCVLSILWALNVAVVRQEYLWAASAVSVSALAAAFLAVGRRSEELAFLAGIGANLASSLFVWHLWHAAPPSWLALVQANVLSSSAVALVWLGVRRLLTDRRPGPLLALQSALGLAAHTILLLWPLAEIGTDPVRGRDPFFADIGSSAGWLAWLLSVAAAYWHLAVSTPRGRIHVLGIAGLSAGVLAACTVSPWDTGLWESFHVLLCAWCALGLAATAIGCVTFSLRLSGLSSTEHGELSARRFAALFAPLALRRWLEGIGLAIFVLTLPSAWGDPWRPMAPAAALLTVSLMAGALAISTRLRHYVWVSGLLLDLIGLLFWSAWGPGTASSFFLMNSIGLAVAAAFWTAVDLALPTVAEATSAGRSPAWITGSSFAHVAANIALALLVLVVSLALVSDLQPPGIAVFESLAWTALAAVAAALLAAVWDRRAGFALPDLYVLGLTAVGFLLHGLQRSPAGLGWSAALMLACYTAIASLIAPLFNRSRDPWFPPAQAAVAGVVIALSIWMCLDFAARVDRLAGPAAMLLLVLADVVMIRRPENDTTPPAAEKWLRPAALALGALAAAEIGWACPDPTGPAVWLHRNVLLMVALAATTMLYGVALPRWLARHAEWLRCARRAGPILGVLASLTLLVLLVQEFRLYDAATRRTPMAWPAVLVVLAALVVLMVSGLRFAVVPGRDPLGLSERGRTLYVYAVELLLVLLFVHVRLNVPELFRGWVARYWTILVMLIAYVGVGLSEFFERRKLRVLAEPLQRTGVFLPLLPLLAFWAKPPAPLLHFADNQAPGLRPMLGYLDKLPQHFDSYAFVWLLVCGLYALVSLTRRSFAFALLAALAANFALWSLLTHQGIAFLLHPQCWLIPMALIVLASEHVNRDRLRPDLAAGLRYLGISMIYVSSTADLFLAGLGNSVVLPIVLAVLALAGILLGILFRVRAFLFLGISFLFLDVFTMIWYAAVDRYQTWVWWVAGIVLGAAILTLFAVFEKRRNDVLNLLEDIKRWD